MLMTSKNILEIIIASKNDKKLNELIEFAENFGFSFKKLVDLAISHDNLAAFKYGFNNRFGSSDIALRALDSGSGKIFNELAKENDLANDNNFIYQLNDSYKKDLLETPGISFIFLLNLAEKDFSFEQNLTKKLEKTPELFLNALKNEFKIDNREKLFNLTKEIMDKHLPKIFKLLVEADKTLFPETHLNTLKSLESYANSNKSLKEREYFYLAYLKNEINQA